MPVILTEEAEIERWMTAPAEDALKLQRPLPDGTLKVVARGEKMDGDPMPDKDPHRHGRVGEAEYSRMTARAAARRAGAPCPIP
jgi:hypothetical protein